jgi:hypothetical protein
VFRIFRRIRKEALAGTKTNHYLLYAAGELLLVIVGILIALQIDNWNEERVEQNEIREYALDLSAAIKRDMEMLVPVDLQIRASIRAADEMAGYIRNRKLEQMNNAELFFLARGIGYRSYAWNRAALDQLKSAGGLRKMRSKELVDRISDYDALTRHLDQDYREDEESVRAILDLANGLIDFNYDPDVIGDALDWNDGFTSTYMEQRFTGFRETALFKHLAGLDWPLLSQDLAAFRHLANLNRDFAEDASARPDIELPRLRQFAVDIQALIDEEYR